MLVMFSQNVWVREVKDAEGVKFEVVDDPKRPDPITSYEDLFEAYADATWFAKYDGGLTHRRDRDGA